MERGKTASRAVALAGAISVLAAMVAGCGGSDPAAGGPAGPAATVGAHPDSTVPGSLPATTRAAGGNTTAGMASGPATTTAPAAPGDWAATDEALRQRLAQAGVGGYLVVLDDSGNVIHERSIGGVARTTPMPVASSTKWLTGAILLGLVEEGRLTLDDPISRWMPEFSGTRKGDRGDITLRQMLSHTSGIRDKDCIWDTAASMAACVKFLADSPLEFAPGTAFSYGNASFHVAGRLAEVITGKDFQTLFAERLGRPLRMSGTGWGGVSNPSAAAGVSTSADDYLRFMEMMRNGGAFEGHRLLSEESVAEIQRNQVKGHDTSHDFAVGITRIPTYGLGLWRDKVDAEDNAYVVSGNGARGFYPWIDHDKATYGVLAVNDTRGAQIAVPASHKVIDLAISASPRS